MQFSGRAGSVGPKTVPAPYAAPHVAGSLRPSPRALPRSARKAPVRAISPPRPSARYPRRSKHDARTRRQPSWLLVQTASQQEGDGKCRSCRHPRTTSVVKEAPELPAPARVLQLPERLGLDLANALTRYRELLADLLERVIGVHADAEAHAQNALFPGGERCERAGGSLAQVRLDGGVDRQQRVLVLDEIAEMGVLLVADRRLQRQRLPGDLEHLAHLLERHAELLGKLLGRRLAADLVEHLPRRAHDLVDRLDH